MIVRDGRLVDRAPSVVPPSAVGGVFTTVGCEHGKPLLWHRHRARLRDGARKLFPGSLPNLPGEDRLSDLLGREGLDQGAARIRVVLWRDAAGVMRHEASASASGKVGPGRAPVKLGIVRWERPPDPSVKWVARSQWNEALRWAQSRGCDDAVLIDRFDRVLETSVANVFVRCGSRILTPPAPELCLPGIMREWVMQVVAEVSEQEFGLESLVNADEVWVTNAVAGIVRVGEIRDRVWRKWPAFEDVAQIGVPAPAWPSAGGNLGS